MFEEFLGQTKIKNSLSYIIPNLYKREKVHLLLVAQSGYGKTYLGQLIQKYVFPLSHKYILPIDGKVNIPPEFNIFIDEVHTLKDPEIIYPLFNEKLFILATNEIGKLKEPLINRCIPLVFEEYTTEEQILISKRFLKSAPDYVYEKIIEISHGVPRLIENYSTMFKFFEQKDGEISKEKLDFYVENVLGIKGGLNKLERDYISFLRKNGPTSITLLSNTLNVGKDYMINYVEPILIKKGLIKITSKGRSCI